MLGFNSKQDAPAQKPNPPKEADLYALRRQKKRRRHMKRAVIFCALAALLMLLYVRRDVWIPKLEDISFSRPTVGQNQGSLSEGNFPLSILGGSDYQTAQMQNLLLILSDAYLYLYKTDGTLAARRQHTYGSAMLQSSGNYAMVYESGGTYFRLESPRKTVFEKSVSDPIVFGRVSESGYTAVVTGSDSSACKLIVFNQKGKQIYQRSCVEKLTEVAFCADESGCYAVSVQTANGTLQSIVHYYDFSQAEERWTSQPLDMFCISVYNMSGGGVFVLGDTCCAYLSLAGATLSTYAYPDSIVCGDCVDGAAAIVLRNEEKRTNSVVLLDGDANAPTVLDFEHEVQCVAVSAGGYVTVQTRDHIQTYRISGSSTAQAALLGTYDKFERIGPYLFLMGYDRIDRIEYAGK